MLLSQVPKLNKRDIIEITFRGWGTRSLDVRPMATDLSVVAYFDKINFGSMLICSTAHTKTGADSFQYDKAEPVHSGAQFGIPLQNIVPDGIRLVSSDYSGIELSTLEGMPFSLQNLEYLEMKLRQTNMTPNKIILAVTHVPQNKSSGFTSRTEIGYYSLGSSEYTPLSVIPLKRSHPYIGKKGITDILITEVCGIKAFGEPFKEIRKEESYMRGYASRKAGQSRGRARTFSGRIEFR